MGGGIEHSVAHETHILEVVGSLPGLSNIFKMFIFMAFPLLYGMRGLCTTVLVSIVGR